MGDTGFVAANPPSDSVDAGPPDDREARDRMPSWLPRAMVLAFVLLGLFELGHWAAHRLTGLFVVMLVAFFVSLAMEPAVGNLAARGMPRGLATGLVFVLLFGCVVGFSAALGTLLVQTVGHVVNELPRLLNELVDWVNRTFHQDFTVDQLRERLLKDSNVITGYAERAANNAWGQFQDYILQPRITARTVDVNPAVALLAVLAGGALLGAVGALLAIPATATVQAFVGLYVRRNDVADDPRIERTARKPRSTKRFRRSRA